MSKTKEIVQFLSQGRAGGRAKIAYMLRSNEPDMTAYGGFVWPRRGPVTCPDWWPTTECGNGLHGLLWGEGNSQLTHEDKPAVWLVCAVWADDVIELGGKVKVPRAWVVRSGTRDHTVTHPKLCGRAVVFGLATAGTVGTATSGYKGTATVGYGGTATAGNFGTATAGDGGTATSGYKGTATAGHCGTATAWALGTATAGNLGTATSGYKGTATAGYAGTATAGEYGTATAGDGGTATSGYKGTATAGYAGTATAGEYGTATAGYGGKVMAGSNGTLRLLFLANNKYRIREAHVGEHGILPNVPYRLNDKGEFVLA